MNNSEFIMGICCPVCKGQIRLTFRNLFLEKSITCPFCNLILDMSIPEGMKSHDNEIILEGNYKNTDKIKEFVQNLGHNMI